MDFTKEVIALQEGVVNTEIHTNLAIVEFGAGIDVRTRLKLLFPIGLRGEFRDFHTLANPSFRRPGSAQNGIISLSREDWLSTASRPRQDVP